MDEAPLLPRLTFSTGEDLPPAERFEAFREEFALRVVRIDIEARDLTAFRTDIRAQPLPGITLSRNTFDGAATLTRTQSLIKDGDDNISFLLCLEGAFDVAFGDEGGRLTPGRAMLMPSDRVGGTATSAHGVIRTLSLRIDRDVARRYLPSVDEMLLKANAADDRSVNLLRAYCDHLMTMPEGLTGSFASLAAGQIAELVGNVFDQTSARVREAASGGVRAGRVQAVLNDISGTFSTRR